MKPLRPVCDRHTAAQLWLHFLPQAEEQEQNAGLTSLAVAATVLDRKSHRRRLVIAARPAHPLAFLVCGQEAQARALKQTETPRKAVHLVLNYNTHETFCP